VEPFPDEMTAGTRSWRRRVRLLARQFADLRRSIKRRLGILAPLHIAMYGGYGTAAHLILRGRVLEERERAAPRLTDSLLANFSRAFWLFESDEVAGVEIELEWSSSSSRAPVGEGRAPLRASPHVERARVVTDEDGYFVLEHRFASPMRPGWLSVQARITQAPYPVRELPTAEGQVLIPAPEARFGVISDIDDTILRSYVQNRARLVYLTLLGNPFTRLPFEGTTELYRGLRQCGQGAPFFYVSKSMWNLFPLLERFIAHQRLPRGPLLLRRLGLFAPRPNVPHKAQAIAELLAAYPTLSFLLIGDSGEHDLTLYLEAARAHPGRVPAILIRNVSRAEAQATLEAMAEQDVPPGCRVLVFDDTRRAIELCTELGYWQPAPLHSLPPPAGEAAS
jgi:phosphatidate phosphatase APP1